MAPPPGTIWVSRWRRIRTGASRETRVISPYWNTSATKSPRRTMVREGKRSTISASRPGRRQVRRLLVFFGRFIAKTLERWIEQFSPQRLKPGCTPSKYGTASQLADHLEGGLTKTTATASKIEKVLEVTIRNPWRGFKLARPRATGLWRLRPFPG
jgi:hypothetical protein